MKNPEKSKNSSPISSSALGSAQPSENIRELYEYVQSSLNFIETKNGVFVALLGGLIIAILSFEKDGNNFWIYLAIIPPTAALIPLLLSFYPVKNRKAGASREAQKNMPLFRCENIAKFSKDELKNLLSEGQELSVLSKHKIEYIHNASKTAARKYSLSRMTIILLFVLYGVYAIALGVVKLIQIICDNGYF
ncbi:MAG: hypothetical protein LBB79_07340 [Prevotellaceae bacterium]|nr:hypothetical protein [Prevotellaceae bacterium]